MAKQNEADTVEFTVSNDQTGELTTTRVDREAAEQALAALQASLKESV